MCIRCKVREAELDETDCHVCDRETGRRDARAVLYGAAVGLGSVMLIRLAGWIIYGI